jgi:Fe-S cluster biogenesis protein NfuA
MGSRLEQALREVVGPLVVADRGELYVAHLDAKQVHLHLRGEFSGCPGNSLVIQKVIEPALRQAAPDAQIWVSSGELLPEGAQRWTPSAQDT